MGWKSHPHASLLQYAFNYSHSLYVTLLIHRIVDVFDGAMVILAIYTLNFAHPGCMIGRGMGKDRAIEEQKRESAIELGATTN